MFKQLSRYIIVSLGIAVFCALNISAQRLVSNVSNGTIRPNVVGPRLQVIFKGDLAANSPQIELKKIVYTTVDVKGRSVNVSGLVAWPTGGAPNGLVVFCHGTIQDRRNSPSKWKGTPNGSEAETATYAFTTGGYAVVIPDYLGLGDHMAAHPYPLNITNARSAKDSIVPARMLAMQSGYKIGPKVYVTGYSEGGGVAMALLKDLESIGGSGFTVEKAVPVSGPYDMTGATREFLLREPTDTVGFGVRLYLLSYAAYYFRKEHNVKITNYFKPAMANSIWLNYNTTVSDENLIKRLMVTAVLMRPKNAIRNLLTPDFVRKIETLDTSDPLIAELAKNNVYDWSPRTPILLVNLEGDTVVNPENTTSAMNAMRRRGIGRDKLRRHIMRGEGLTHVTAVPNGMAAARKFFDDGFAGVRDAQ
jgi:Predicted hydrolase of the alpha/beta superfamily